MAMQLMATTFDRENLEALLHTEDYVLDQDCQSIVR